MESVTLNNGMRMPSLGLGTYQLEGDICREVTSSALQMGYRHIDTATVYENQSAIGEAIRDWPREELFITSKVAPNAMSYDATRQDVEQTLHELSTKYLDLLLIHWPNSNCDMTETLRAFSTLLEEGKIKAAGVSNFTITHLEYIVPESPIEIQVNQVEYHPLLNQEELLSFCRKNKIAVTAYSPLARGDVVENSVLLEIGKRHSRTAAQVALRWLIQKGLVVIPKGSSSEHLRQNLACLDSKRPWQLSQEEMKSIDNIDQYERKIQPDYAEFHLDDRRPDAANP